MRKILLLGLVVAIMVVLLGCPSGLGNLNTLGPETENPTEAPTGIVTIVNWNQVYYSGSGYWRPIVEIYFTVENTGTVEIDYYEVYFTIIAIDGSQYIGLGNGGDILVGETITDYVFAGVEKKEVVSVSIYSYEL